MYIEGALWNSVKILHENAISSTYSIFQDKSVDMYEPKQQLTLNLFQISEYFLQTNLQFRQSYADLIKHDR